MKSTLLFLTLILFFQTACKKDATVSSSPKADFTFGSYNGLNETYTDTVLIIGTHDALVLRNQSTDADSISWNFGDGRTSNQANTILSYDKPGKYTVTLFAYGRNGNKNELSRSITVMERKVTSFSINNIDINKFSPAQNGLPVFSKINLWLEIKFSQSNSDGLTSDGDIQVPVVYVSPVFSNIDSSFHSSINFTIPSNEKVIINYPVNNSDYTSQGKGLIINLYGQDDSGTYLLSSSAWSGIGISILNAANPALAPTFGLQTFVAGSPTNIKLDCSYQ